jgi:hypothetical protein
MKSDGVEKFRAKINTAARKWMKFVHQVDEFHLSDLMRSLAPGFIPGLRKLHKYLLGVLTPKRLVIRTPMYGVGG